MTLRRYRIYYEHRGWGGYGRGGTGRLQDESRYAFIFAYDAIDAQRQFELSYGRNDGVKLHGIDPWPYAEPYFHAIPASVDLPTDDEGLKATFFTHLTPEILRGKESA